MVRKSFGERVNEILKSKQEINMNDNVERRWNNLKISMKKASEEEIGYSKHQPKKPWGRIGRRNKNGKMES